MSVRTGLTAIDQGVCSVSNFAVAVIVARVAGVGSLGAFSIVYAAWLITVAMHRALITDPMAIEGDLRKPDAAAHVRAGLAAELVLGAGVAAFFGLIGVALVVTGHGYLGIPFVAVAPWLPFLLAQDYWRWIGFMQAQPAKSLLNDGVFDIVQAIAYGLLLAFGTRSSALAITAWCGSAAAGAVFGLWQFNVRPTWRGGWSRLRLRLGLGKWIAGVNATTWGASQSSIVLAGAFLGTVGIGGLKAATSLVAGPAMVLIQAGGSVGLPEASRSLSERGWPGLRRVSRAVTAAGVASMALILVIVLLFGRQLLGTVFGPAFSRFAPVADILALSCCIGTAGLGAILSIKATKQPGLLFRVGLVSLVVSVLAVTVLTPLYGIDGAAWAAVISNSVMTALQLSAHWRRSRPRAEALFANRLVEPEAYATTSDADRAVPDQLVSLWEVDGSERSPLLQPTGTVAGLEAGRGIDDLL
jgi:O-antigen/teichoic acid export membrane protein